MSMLRVAACAVTTLCVVGVEHTQAALLGGVKDDYGCIPSAGYRWNHDKQACMRSWENQLIYGVKDAHGCVASEGYTWNAETRECAQNWQTLNIVGKRHDDHGCLISAGYKWDNDLKSCVRPWETHQPDLIGDKVDVHGCLTSAGYVYDLDSKECVRPWGNRQPYVETPQDQHGCLESAGYKWDEVAERCINIHTLPAADQVPHSHEAHSYLEESKPAVVLPPTAPVNPPVHVHHHHAHTHPVVGGEGDEHECTSRAGHVWNAIKKKCVAVVGGDRDEYECTSRPGHVWNSIKNKCVAVVDGDHDEHECTSRAGHLWDAIKKKCVAVVGGDRDRHECASRPGHVWNSIENKCVAVVGGEPDEHECTSRSGHVWNAIKQKCVAMAGGDRDRHECTSRPGHVWDATKNECVAVGGDRDEHECASRPGHVWNSIKKKCAAVVGGDRDEHECVSSAGYVWNSIKNKCVRPWEECSTGYEWNPDEATCALPWAKQQFTSADEVNQVVRSTFDPNFRSSMLSPDITPGTPIKVRYGGVWRLLGFGPSHFAIYLGQPLLGDHEWVHELVVDRKGVAKQRTVTLERFLKSWKAIPEGVSPVSETYWKKPNLHPISNEVVVGRALNATASHVRYAYLGRNCEHHISQIVFGEPISPQGDYWLQMVHAVGIIWGAIWVPWLISWHFSRRPLRLTHIRAENIDE